MTPLVAESVSVDAKSNQPEKAHTSQYIGFNRQSYDPDKRTVTEWRNVSVPSSCQLQMSRKLTGKAVSS